MVKRPWIIPIILACLLLVLPTFSYSHPGRTDAQGGHYDRKTGEYHYHNKGYSSPKPEAYQTETNRLTTSSSPSLGSQSYKLDEKSSSTLPITDSPKSSSTKTGSATKEISTKEEIKKGSISDPRTVKRVIDGDTLELENGEKVRLIGVDTPETKHPKKPVQRFGKEASAFTKKVVEGKKIRLKYDWQNKDKYGRTLAYVYTEDGVFLNAELIRQGYGHAYTKYPFEHIDEFREYERNARDNKKGLWGD